MIASGAISGSGALSGRGVKQRILSALVVAAVWFAFYEAFILIINNVIFDNNGNTLAIAAAYTFTGLYSIAVLLNNLKKLKKEAKK